METRNLQRTGGTSFTVTLPKQWVEDMGLKDKDPLFLSAQPEGSLIIEPAILGKKKSTATLNIKKQTTPQLTRELIGYYLSGVDEIYIKSSKITQDQRVKLRQIIQNLVGFEIIDESSTQILIKNIFDISKFPAAESVEKMFLMASSMFTDAVNSFLQDDVSLSHDVITRDIEVDKLHFVIIRQFHSLISGKVSERETGLHLLDLNYYAFIGEQIERIADHAVKIAQSHISGIKIKDKKLFEKLEKDTKEIIVIIGRSSQMVKTLDKKIGHSILDDFSVSGIDKTIPLIWDSLDRVHRYILNIAERTIDQAIMKGI